MRRYWLLLRRVDAWTREQERFAAAEDIQALAKAARNKILDAIARHKRGESLPTLSVDRDSEPSEARDRLQQKLRETGERLRRYAELRGEYGIR